MTGTTGEPSSKDGAVACIFGWRKGAAAFDISSRRAAGSRGSRIILSMYSSGISPPAAAASRMALVDLQMAPRGRPAPGRFPPRGIADSPSFLIELRWPLPSIQNASAIFTPSIERFQGHPPMQNNLAESIRRLARYPAGGSSPPAGDSQEAR